MMAPTEDCRIREGLIHRSAWKGNFAKSRCSILHRPTPMPGDNGLFSTLRLLARHEILEQRIVIRCSANHRTRWADIEPSANSMVGVGLEKWIPIFLIAHPLEKSASSSTNTSIHRLSPL